MAQLGSSGVEEVTKHVNGYFGQLIEKIYEHSGDILKFAGDALLVMFGEPDSKEDLQITILRAVQCALDIQSSLRQYMASGVKLTLHIGIGAGDLTSLLVGGVDNNWEWLVSGHCLGQLDSTVEASKEGEVVISDVAYQIVNGKVNVQKRANDWLVETVTSPVAVVANGSLDVPVDIEACIRCHLYQGILA
jgi:class 3 adenylate cyclase